MMMMMTMMTMVMMMMCNIATEIGGSGFVLACEDFGRMFDHLFPTCVFF